MNARHARILHQMNRELDAATAEFMRMQHEEMEIIREAPSGLPLPDGQARIIQAGKAAKAAYENYRLTAKRYRDFVEHGIVPGDLNPGGLK